MVRRKLMFCMKAVMRLYLRSLSSKVSCCTAPPGQSCHTSAGRLNSWTLPKGAVMTHGRITSLLLLGPILDGELKFGLHKKTTSSPVTGRYENLYELAVCVYVRLKSCSPKVPPTMVKLFEQVKLPAIFDASYWKLQEPGAVAVRSPWMWAASSGPVNWPWLKVTV